MSKAISRSSAFQSIRSWCQEEGYKFTDTTGVEEIKQGYECAEFKYQGKWIYIYIYNKGIEIISLRVYTLAFYEEHILASIFKLNEINSNSLGIKCSIFGEDNSSLCLEYECFLDKANSRIAPAVINRIVDELYDTFLDASIAVDEALEEAKGH